jgi:hypothetical protein
MSKRTQLRRGTTSEHDLYQGLDGEVTVDTDKNTVVSHDRELGIGPVVTSNDPTLQGTVTVDTGIEFSDGSRIETAPLEYFYMLYPGTLYPPVYGTRYYPEKSILVTELTFTAPTASINNTKITIIKNGEPLYGFTFPVGEYKVTHVFDEPISLTIFDYLVVNIFEGGGENLAIKFGYLTDVLSETLPIPTFELSSSTTTSNEGTTVTFTVNTENVADDGLVAYEVSGVLPEDFTGNNLTGNFIITDNTGTLDFFIKNDLLTEGTETIVMSILFQGITESTVAVNINDTSIDPLTASPVTITEGNSFDVTYTNPEAGNTVKIYTLTGPGITLSDIQSVKQTFTVTTSGGKYLLNGVESPNLTFSKAQTFVYNLDDASNDSHPLLLSYTVDGTHNSGTIYNLGVTYKLDGVIVSSSAYITNFATATTRSIEVLVSPSETDGLSYYSNTSTGHGANISIVGENRLQGVINVFNNTGIISVKATEDLTTEGTETIVINVDDAGAGDLSVDITDTSTGNPPTYALTADVTNPAEGTSVVITLTTQNVLTGTTVPYTITGITADDLTSGSIVGSFTQTGGIGTQSFSIAGDLVEENEVLTLTIDASGDYIAIPITDKLALSAPAEVNEGVTFTVTLRTVGITDNTTYDYTITGISAADLNVGSLTGTFTIIDNIATVQLQLANDAITEGSETITFSLDNGAYDIDIIALDSSLDPTYSLSGIDETDEGETITITCTTTDVFIPTTVGYTVTGITADDLSAGSLTGLITIVNNTGTVDFTFSNDLAIEGPETFKITLDATDSNGRNTGSVFHELVILDTSTPPPGQLTFAGTSSWTVPSGIGFISAVAIGKGAKGGIGGTTYQPPSGSWGGGQPGGGGGGAGGLAYSAGFVVTPGEVLTMAVTSTESMIQRGTTELLKATAGTAGADRVTSAGGGTGGSYSGTEATGGGLGGSGGSASYSSGGGGGGAGGYYGSGGSGSGTLTTSASGQGGGGSGGTAMQTHQYSVNYQYGTVWFYYTGNGGKGGGQSETAYASQPTGGVYGRGKDGNGPGNYGYGGGGGAGGHYTIVVENGPNYQLNKYNSGSGGGSGIIRIIWGANRAYPSTNTEDQ